MVGTQNEHLVGGGQAGVILSQDQLGKGFAAGNGDTVIAGVTGILEELRNAINGLPGDDHAHKREATERLQDDLRSRMREATHRNGTECPGEGGTRKSVDGDDMFSDDALDDDDDAPLVLNATAGAPFRKSDATDRPDIGGDAQRAAPSGAKGSDANPRKKK